MKGLMQVIPVVFASLVPALVYSAVVSVSPVITENEATLIAWAALAMTAVFAWRGVDEYFAQRGATVAAMKQFGETFVREFERPLLQPDRAERPIASQLRAIPDRKRLEICLAPRNGRRYPNLSDHRTNVAYDVIRVLELVQDRRFVCEAVYAQGSWVVVPFQFHVGTKQAGGR
ncbi:MAG TPA: hypothetical protein VIK60_08135 [Vicinamibacterales bacterium]